MTPANRMTPAARLVPRGTHRRGRAERPRNRLPQAGNGHSKFDGGIPAAAGAHGEAKAQRADAGKKREIYRAIQEQRGTELLGTTRATGLEAWQQRGNLLDAILAGVGSLVEYFTRHPDYLRLVLREEKAWGVGPARTRLEQTVMWREGIEGAVMAMRQGIAEGVLVDEDPDLMARSWVAMQQAHLGYWLEQGRRVEAGEVVRRLQRQFLRAFCRPAVVAARRLEEKE